MGSAQSTRIESSPKDDASGQENIEIVCEVFDSEDEYSSSDEEESSEEDVVFEERLLILEECRQLRKLAEFFLYPEKPVEVDPSATARCYFDRPSAEVTEDPEESMERDQILEVMKAMKKLAVDYLHPELPVTVTDPCACGRNYFNRPSAEVTEDPEESMERDQILEDMKAMKKLAVDYLHPELPVTVTDPCACGRNYFNRPSAKVTEDPEESMERHQILEDTKAMKKLAVDYLHPELPVTVTDPCACGRNYFNRPSAKVTEDPEESMERHQILEDMKAMKKLAVDYLHPELPVTVTDPCACGRNYFNRPSAKVTEDPEESMERHQILEDMKAMKKLAVDYLHPELPVTVTDPCAGGRNYFTRPSADPYDVPEEENERYTILEELRWMKTLAQNFMHPEIPIDYSVLEEEGHFEMDEEITTSNTTYQVRGPSDSGHVKPSVSGELREESLAFSPDCVMMMH